MQISADSHVSFGPDFVQPVQLQALSCRGSTDHGSHHVGYPVSNIAVPSGGDRGHRTCGCNGDDRGEFGACLARDDGQSRSRAFRRVVQRANPNTYLRDLD